MNAAAASNGNGQQARIENLTERVNKIETNVGNLIQHGCPVGRTEARSFEKGLEELRKDINELYGRMRGVESNLHRWGGGIAMVVVITSILARLL